jgi:autotransporter adhesin
MANIPQVDQGKTFSVGAGVSSFMGANALAIGATYRLAQCGGEGFRRGAE